MKTFDNAGKIAPNPKPCFYTHTPPQYSCSVTATVALSNRTENTTTTTERWAEQRNRKHEIPKGPKPHVEILVFQFNQS